MIYGHIGDGKSQEIKLSMYDQRKALEKQGFIFLKSLKAGKNSIYTFKNKTTVCSIGFDSIDEAVCHIVKQFSNGKNPFMIF